MHYGKKTDSMADINNSSFNNKSRPNSVHNNNNSHITNSQRRRKNQTAVNIYHDEAKMPTVKEILSTEADLNSTRNFIYSKNEIFNTYNCSATSKILEKPSEIIYDNKLSED